MRFLRVLLPLLVFLLGFFGGIFGYMVGLWAASEKYHAVASWQMLISCLLATGGILSVELVLFAQGRFIPGKAGHAILQASAISAAVVFSHIKGPAGVYEFLKKLG